MFMYALNCFPTMCLWLSTGTPGSKSAFFACVMCIYLLIVFEIAVFMYVFPIITSGYSLEHQQVSLISCLCNVH